MQILCSDRNIQVGRESAVIVCRINIKVYADIYKRKTGHHKRNTINAINVVKGNRIFLVTDT